MAETIAKYADIIYMQTHILIDPSLHLNAEQSRVVRCINTHTQQLLNFLRTYEHIQPNLTEENIRHELINILTPIVGYIDMLADEWIGSLTTQQFNHVELIYQCVQALKQYVLSQRFKVNISASA
ncbi:MAG: hypothetical protein Phog2KO_48310 [Phototrophicaceae bacterium]